MDYTSLEVPSDNPNGYCRLCFSQRNLVALFPKDAAPRKLLVQLISQIVGIEVTQGSNIPTSICWRCAVALEDFQQFQHRSLMHDAIIQSKFSDELEAVLSKEKIDWTPVESSTADLLIDQNVVEARREKDDEEEAQEPVVKSESDENQVNDKKYERDLKRFKQTKVTDKSKTFICHFQLCRKSFISYKLLYAHYKSEHSDFCRPFQCDVCHAKFKRKTHLEEHVATHSRSTDARYTCKDCGNTYAQERSLTFHRKRAHAYKPPRAQKTTNKKDNKFKCSFCPKTFKHGPSLNFHVKSHYDKLAFVCEVCGARFANEHGKIVHKGKYHPNMAAKDLQNRAVPTRKIKQRRSKMLHMVEIHQDDGGEAAIGDQFVEDSNNDDGNQTSEDMHSLLVKLEVEDYDLV